MSSDGRGDSISSLTAATSVDGTELVPLTQSTRTKRTTLQIIADWIVQTALSFTQAGAGAVSEAVQTVLRYLLVSVKSFGATGDGTTDDTAAIQAAITAASSGRSVFFPDGTYRCTANISIASKTGLCLFGERNARIIWDDGAYTGLTIASTSNRILIHNIEFRGTSSSSTQLTLLGIDGPYCWVRECEFINADTCISLGPSATTYIVKIHGNHFAGYDRAITMGTGAGTWNVDYDISANTFGTGQASSTQPAVEIQDGAGIRVRGNYFELQLDNKLSISVLSGRASISDNDFVDSGGILSAGNGIISGNNFTECATRDTVIIDITGAENVVTGNFLNESSVIASSIGIRCSSNNNILAPNFMDRFVIGFYISGDDNTIGGGAYTCTTGIEFTSGAIRNDYGGLKLRNNTTAVTDPNAADANYRFQHTSVSSNRGDAAATLAPGQSCITNVWNTALTVDREVTLSTTNAINGMKFRIVRTAAATGVSNLNVGTGPLKALAAGTWCDVEYDGSAWFLAAYGAL